MISVILPSFFITSMISFISGFIFGTAEREYIFSNDLEESNLNNLNNINPNNSLTLLQ